MRDLSATSLRQSEARSRKVRAYDVFFRTETWHTTSEDIAFRRVVPPDNICIDFARPTTTEAKATQGGVATIISSVLRYQIIAPSLKTNTFESVCFTVTGTATTVAVLLPYRPGSVVVTDVFLDELAAYFAVLVLYKCQIVIAGDINIHMEITDDRHPMRLRDIIDSFDCIQQVPLQPTHPGGGTLDLVVTKVEQEVLNMAIDQPDVISDHGIVGWRIPFRHQYPIVLEPEFRRWSKLNKDEFRSALLSSELCDIDRRPGSMEEYFNMYHYVLQSLADTFAPIKKITVRRQRLAPWMDDGCRVRRRHSCQLERRCRK